MINLCYVITGAKNTGPCNVIYNLCMALPSSKYKLHLVTLYRGNDSNLVARFKNNGVTVTELNYKNRWICLLNIRDDLTQYCRLNDIDIIHSHTLFSDLSASMIKNVIKVSTIHNRTFEDYKYLYGGLLGKWIAKLHIHIFKKMNRCVCCSKSVYDEQKKYLKYLSVVQNGVCVSEVNEFVTKKSVHIPDEACVFIYVGSLSKRKNVVMMINEFVKNRRDIDYLLVLGEGQEFESCKNISDDHIKFLGFVNNPSDYYSMSDVYISASNSEGLSLSQLESLSFGLKQLVSDIPSHREVVEINSVVGKTFSDDNFTDAFNDVINDIGEETKQKIRDVFFDYFSANHMVDGYNDIYTFYKEKGKKDYETFTKNDDKHT